MKALYTQPRTRCMIIIFSSKHSLFFLTNPFLQIPSHRVVTRIIQARQQASWWYGQVCHSNMSVQTLTFNYSFKTLDPHSSNKAILFLMQTARTEIQCNKHHLMPPELIWSDDKHLDDITFVSRSTHKGYVMPHLSLLIWLFETIWKMQVLLILYNIIYNRASYKHIELW